METQKSDFSETKLIRTGKRPMAFMGRELFSDSTKTHNTTRWTKVSVHETDKGKVVVGVGHITCWDGEKDRFSVDVFETRDQAVAHIEEHASELAESVADKLSVVERL